MPDESPTSPRSARRSIPADEIARRSASVIDYYRESQRPFFNFESWTLRAIRARSRGSAQT